MVSLLCPLFSQSTHDGLWSTIEANMYLENYQELDVLPFWLHAGNETVGLRVNG